MIRTDFDKNWRNFVSKKSGGDIIAVRATKDLLKILRESFGVPGWLSQVKRQPLAQVMIPGS